jgi:hypothetical protein
MRLLPAGLKGLVAILFAALFFFGMQAPAAHASGEINLIVNLTSKSGTALSGVKIFAYQWENHGAKPFAPVVESTSAGTGKYHLDGLDAGQEYTLYFDAPSTATTSFDQFLGGTTWIEEASTMTWFASKNFDVSLATNSTIAGTVTGTSSAKLSGVTVYPLRFDGSDWFALYNKRVTTSSSGAYALRNLEPGSYKIAFQPKNTSGYLPEYSGNVTDDTLAAPVYVGLGQTSTSNAQLAKGGSIAGKVALEDAFGSYYPTHMTALAYPYDTGSNTIDTSVSYESKPTTSNGKWTVAGLPTGTYAVKLYDFYYGYFYPGWSPDASSLSSATKYNVVAPGTVSTGTTTLFGDDDTQNVHLVITHNSGVFDSSKASVYIESNDGEDYYYQLTPDDIGHPWGLSNGVANINFPRVPSGSYTVYVDPGVAGIAPFIGTKTKGSSATTWNIDLGNPSSFTFSTPPSLVVGGTDPGDTLSVTGVATSLDPDVDVSYIWLRDDRPIFGYTGATYYVHAPDAGHDISVIVRADKFGYAPLVATLSGPSIPEGVAPNNVTAPSISGPATPVSGDTLTADVGDWEPAIQLGYSYEWKNGGTLLGTGKTYKVRPVDAGQTISLLVTATAPGRPDSAPVAASNTVSVGYLPAPIMKTSPKVTSVKTSTSTKFTVSKGTWTPAPTTTFFTFYINGTFVAANTNGQFTCTKTPDNCGSTSVLEVQVSAQVPGALSGEKRLIVRKATAASIFSPVGAGSADDVTAGNIGLIDSSLVDIGHALTVTTPPTYYFGGDPGAITYAYQWLHASDLVSTWQPIAGATSATYHPTLDMLDEYLQVRVTTKTANYGNYTDPTLVPAGRVQLNQLLLNVPLPSVSVPGNNYVGIKYRAIMSGPWPIPNVTSTFTWYECNDNIPANVCEDFGGPLSPDYQALGTGPTYTPDSSHVGWKLMAGVTASAPGYEPVSFRSGVIPLDGPISGGAYALTLPTIASGLVNGKAQIGKPLTATPAEWDNPATIVTQQWEYCPAATTCSMFSGWEVIPGSLPSLTYTPTGDIIDLSNGLIRYTELGAYDADNDPNTFNPYGTASTDDLQLQPLTLKMTKAPSFAKVGTNWVVNPGTWTAGTTFTYKWHLGDTLQPQSSNTYPVTTVGPIFVTIIAHHQGYADVNKRLVLLKGKPAKNPSTVSPSVFGSGPMAADSPMLTFDMVDPEATYAYQWYTGSTAMGSNGKHETYTPAASLVGKSVKLKVTITSPLYATTSMTSSAVTITAHAAASGTAALASDLSAFYAGATMSVSKTGFPAGTTYTYKWERSNDGSTGWTQVSTASTLKLAGTDLSKYFRSTIVAKTAGWTTPPPVVSDVIQVVTAPTIDTIGAPQLLATGGGPRVGSPLTFDVEFNTTGLTLQYAWFRNDIQVEGATGPTWTPLGGSLGDEVYAQVSATKSGSLPAQFFSNSVRIGEGTAPVQTAPAKISGMTGSGTPKAPKVGNVLSATPGTWNVDGLTFTYQWQLNGVDIPFQDRSTYTVAVGDVGGTLNVLVFATRTGWDNGSSPSSAPTKTVQP